MDIRHPVDDSPEAAVGRHRRVLVATDMTAASAGAVRAGIDMARRSGASLVVLSVIDASHLRLPGGLFQRRVDQVRAERESALVGVVADARGLGVAAQFLIWEGDPGPSLVDAAEAENADIIVVGSRGRGSIGRLLLGSVSSYVVANARKPVVVIRPGWRPDDASTLEPMTRMKRARAADPGSRS